MTAPKGTYSKPGKPTLYSEEVLDRAYQYLNACQEEENYEDVVPGPRGGEAIRRYTGKIRMPNAGGLAVYLEVAKSTLYDWEKVHPDFSYFMELMNSVREDRLHEGGLSGRYASNITAIMLGKYGYHKVVENNITNPDGSMNPLKQLSVEELKALAHSQNG